MTATAPSYSTVVSCAHPACPSRRSYPYGAEMSRIASDLVRHGWTAKRIGSQNFQMCPTHRAYDGTQPSQALEEYIKGDFRALDGVRATRQSEGGPAAFTEASEVARRIRTDNDVLPPIKELAKNTAIALAEIRNSRGQEIPRWEIETVILRMIANGDLILVEHEHGGRLHTAHRETKQGLRTYPAIQAADSLDLAFCTADGTIARGLPEASRRVPRGANLAWVEQVVDFFGNLLLETMTQSYSGFDTTL